MKYDRCSDSTLLEQLFKEGGHTQEGAYEARIASKGFARKIFWGKMIRIFGVERAYVAAWRRYRHAEMQAILCTAENAATAVVADADKLVEFMESEHPEEELGLDDADKILKRMERNEFLTSVKMVKANVERIFNDIEELSHAKKERDAINEQMKGREEELLIQKEVLLRRTSVAHDEGIVPADYI